MLLLVGAGAALGLGFVAMVRAWDRAHERSIYALGLLGAALIYMGFAALEARPLWLLAEGSGVIVFGGLAWLGMRGAPLLLALGWGLHAAWDAGLHGLVSPGLAPSWYPSVCAGFDLALCAYIAAAFRPGVPQADTRPRHATE